MKKIVTIVGARPQFIKAAAVSRALQEQKGQLVEVLVHTGQHYDDNMSQVFFDEMRIPKPDYHLEVGSGPHGQMTGKMLIKIEELLLSEKPDYVLVYGDTNSTLAGALAAVKLHIPVAHVEAGLRSFNRKMPEEHNRVLTDHVSDFLFCPTETAVNNLVKEGFSINQRHNSQPLVVNCGDVMYDAFLFYSELSAQKSKVLNDLELKDKDFVLCTIHRAENTDDPKRLKNILSFLEEISQDTTVVLPLHPRTAKILEKNCQLSVFSCQLKIIDPVSYFDMVELLKQCRLVMTDSGGLQKEAFYAKAPCVTMRDETEWVETVKGGYNLVVGADKKAIISGFEKMLDSKADYSRDLYGDGAASQKIVKAFVS